MDQAFIPVTICLSVCRGGCVLAVLILGCMISVKLSGVQYYALVDGDDETIGPYCRVIEHTLGPGTEVGPDVQFGGQGVDTGIGGSAQVGVQNIQDSESYNFGDTSYQFSVYTSGIKRKYEGCNYQIVKAEDKKTVIGPEAPWDEGTHVEILDMTAKKPLRMPNFCGEDEPGTFLDVGSEDRDDRQGMWVSPLVLGLCFWFCFRIGSLACQIFLDSAVLELEAGGKYAANGVLFLVNVICCQFFIAPLQNMEFHEDCSSLLLSYYSGRLQMSFFVGVCLMFCMSCCIMCPMGCGVGEDAKECAMGIFGCFAVCTGICMFVGGVWYHIKKAWWAMFIGLEFNLSWYFPEIDLAMNINILHLMTFFLWLGDVVQTISSCVKICAKVADA